MLCDSKLTTRSFDVRKLLLPSLGLLLTVVGMTVCREAVRIAALGWQRFEAMHPVHADAYGRGGVVVFLVFFVVNAGLIVFVFWIVRNRSIPKAGA